MAVLRVRKITTINRVELFLQGAIFGGNDLRGQVAGLVGNTITFAKPAAASCAFVAGANAGYLTAAEIKAQLEAAITGLKVKFLEGRIVLIETSPSGGVQLGGGVQIAKTLLGFAKNSTEAGRVYNPPDGAAPRLISVSPDMSNSHVIITEE